MKSELKLSSNLTSKKSKDGEIPSSPATLPDAKSSPINQVIDGVLIHTSKIRGNPERIGFFFETKESVEIESVHIINRRTGETWTEKDWPIRLNAGECFTLTVDK